MNALERKCGFVNSESHLEYDTLLMLWKRALAKCIAAEAILDRIQDGHGEACHHLVQGWKIIAAVLIYDVELSLDLQQLAVDSVEEIVSALAASDFSSQTPLKLERFEDELRKLFSLHDLYVSSGKSKIHVTKVTLYNHVDFLRKVLAQFRYYLDDKHHQLSFVARFSHRFALCCGLLIPVILYLVAAVYGGDWNPAGWFVIKMDQFSITGAEQGWGTLEINRNVMRTDLSIAGKKYEKGLGTHAPSVIRLRFSPEFKRFSGACGVDDYWKTAGSLICIIKHSDRILFESPFMRYGRPAKPFSVPVDGIDHLELVVSDAQDGQELDLANWVDLKLSK